MRSGVLDRLRGGLLLAVGFVLAASPAARAEEPPPGSVPLPLSATATVRARNGTVYYVDGRAEVPPDALIRIEAGVRVVGINRAALDVRGGLEVHGSQGKWVVLEGLDLSPTLAPKKGIRLSGVSLRKCRLVHDGERGFVGRLTIESSTFQRDCAFDVRLEAGTLELRIVDSAIPWSVRCEPEDDRAKPIEVRVERCWAKKVELRGPADVTLQHSEFQGGLVCNGVTEVTVDGCDVTEALGFYQGRDDSFRKIRITKCNLFDGCRLILDRAGAAGSKVERVRVDRCYFGPREGGQGVTELEALRDLVRDDADYDEQAVVARIVGPQRRKHLHVDYGRLRTQIPPLD